VEVRDSGIRAIHLAYERLDGRDTLIPVNATACGDAPETVFVLEVDLNEEEHGFLVDVHGMAPRSVLNMVSALGGRIGRVFIVGCEPPEIVERIRLSEPAAQEVATCSGPCASS
jgi:hydrogenase maturation protease